MENTHEIRFAAEKTLGKLAKWLRILGFDTIYEPDLTTDKLVCIGEGRILLSRTARIRRLCASQKLILIISDNPIDQLSEVIQTLDIALRDTIPFSRCVRCNTHIQKVERDAVRKMVPDYVWETHHEFRSCRQCRRVYWSGTHTQRIHEILERLFK